MKRIAVILLIVIYSFGQNGTKFGAGISLGTASGIEAKLGNKWEVHLSLGYYGLLGREKEIVIHDFYFGDIRKKYSFDLGLNVLSYAVKNFNINDKFVVGFGTGFGYRRFWNYTHSYPDLDVKYVHALPEEVFGFYLVPIKVDYNINNYTFWLEGGFYLPAIYEANIVSFSPLANIDNNNEFMIRIGVFRNVSLGKEK